MVGNLTIILLAAVPLGYYGDRLPRRKIVLVGAILAGVFSFATGVAPFLALLVVFRLGNGIGRLTNDSIHNSLLADYYTPSARAGVFGMHRNAVYFGAIVGSAPGRRARRDVRLAVAFVFLLVPAARRRVPGDASSKSRYEAGRDNLDAAEAAEKEEPVPFAEARRILLSVKTLRRQFAAWLFIGAGVVPLAYLLPLFLEEEFGARTVPAGSHRCSQRVRHVHGVQSSEPVERRAGSPRAWASRSSVPACR